MLASAPERHRLAGDAEHLPLATAAVGLYWSSLTSSGATCPWPRLRPTASFWPGGRLAVATPAREPSPNWWAAFCRCRPHRHTLDFSPRGRRRGRSRFRRCPRRAEA